MDVSILDIISRIEKDQKKLGITLYPKATENEILSFERVIGRKLPYDVRLFYSFANGFESAEDMFRIIPLDEINENDRSYIKEVSDFQFAEYMIYSDSWILSVDANDSAKYEIYDYSHNLLTHSFSNFLNVFLDKGVYEFYEWRDESTKEQ